METRNWLSFKQKRNLLKVTVELREFHKRKTGEKRTEEGLHSETPGWFAEDATPARTLMGSQVPADIGHHMLDPATLAYLPPCASDCTMATLIIPN